jgi:hypothetical protein
LSRPGELAALIAECATRTDTAGAATA